MGAGELDAQQRIRVVNVTGTPLIATRVELWSPSALIVARSTDEAGVAHFLPAELTRANAILIRRLGFLPARHRVDQALDSLLVRLEPIGGALPTVTVVSTRRSCPEPDQPAARVQWERAAARYRTPSLEGREATTVSRRNTVDEDGVGDFEDRALATGSRAYTHWGMLGAHKGLARGLYVSALSGSHTYDDFGIWWYPDLHAEMAGAFADSSFAAHHTFTPQARTSTYRVIRFCARDRKRPGLDGTLRIDASDSFVDARWTFWNPSRDAESAGGEVLFAPPADTGRAPLFSANGLFWRKLPSGRYLQSWQGYSAWKLMSDSFGRARRSPASP